MPIALLLFSLAVLPTPAAIQAPSASQAAAPLVESFSASPVAADGRLYFANEDGDVFVARAGRTYQEVARNSMKEVIMSTPAIADGTVVPRTLHHVHGIGQK